MRFSRQNGLKISVILMLFPIIFSCGPVSGSNYTESSPIPIEVDTSGATAFVLFTDQYSTSLSAFPSYYLSEDEAITNLYKLLEDGSLEQVFDRVQIQNEEKIREGTLDISVYRMDKSPDGSIYVYFRDPVLYNDTVCTWMVLTDNGVAACVDTYMGRSSSPEYVQFNNNGDVYYFYEGYEEGGIRKRSTDGQITSILTYPKMISIDFWLGSFEIISDDIYLLNGSLRGMDNDFFLYMLESESLIPLCLTFTYNNRFWPYESNIIIDQDATWYSGGYGTCDGQYFSGLIRWDFEDNGDYTFTQISELKVEVFHRSYDGKLYALSLTDNTALELGKQDNSSTIPIIEDDSIEVNLVEIYGDYVYYTGTNADGNYIFIRRHFLGDGTEVDLLEGQNLFVQQFDVHDNGDVYFGAVDLSPLARYLYKYNYESNKLEVINSLPDDVENVIILKEGTFWQ